LQTKKKNQRDEEKKYKECCNCLRCTQIDCQIGASFAEKQKQQNTVRPKESAIFFFLMLF
jgi:hypothetical protein